MKLKIALAAATFAAAITASAEAQRAGIELGLLDCVVDGGVGFVVGSNKNVSCTYKPADASLAPESYFGAIRKFGLDIGATDDAVLQWAVLGPNGNIYAPGALAGDYVGASTEATAVVGVGANVLVGGSQQAFTLQPVSVQAQTGLNLAIGISDFRLRSAE